MHDAHGDEQSESVGEYHNPTVEAAFSPFGIFGMRSADIVVKTVEKGHENAGDHNVAEAWEKIVKF